MMPAKRGGMTRGKATFLYEPWPTTEGGEGPWSSFSRADLRSLRHRGLVGPRQHKNYYNNRSKIDEAWVWLADNGHLGDDEAFIMGKLEQKATEARAPPSNLTPFNFGQTLTHCQRVRSAIHRPRRGRGRRKTRRVPTEGTPTQKTQRVKRRRRHFLCERHLLCEGHLSSSPAYSMPWTLHVVEQSVNEFPHSIEKRPCHLFHLGVDDKDLVGAPLLFIFPCIFKGLSDGL